MTYSTTQFNIFACRLISQLMRQPKSSMESCWQCWNTVWVRIKLLKQKYKLLKCLPDPCGYLTLHPATFTANTNTAPWTSHFTHDCTIWVARFWKLAACGFCWPSALSLSPSLKILGPGGLLSLPESRLKSKGDRGQSFCHQGPEALEGPAWGNQAVGVSVFV